MNDVLLNIQNLDVAFKTRTGLVNAINSVSYEVRKGEVLGIVGESGCGKSVSMNAVMRLLPDNAVVRGGSITYKGRNIADYSEKEMQQIRGNEITMIFQDPMSSLDPLYTVGNQMVETICRHKKLNKKDAAALAIDYLSKVGIHEPKRCFKQYPFELSGGMRQRIVIATALCCDPDLMIADEPTTALDVTIQAQILDLMTKLHKELNNAIVFITHNMGIVSGLCDRILVMYAGRIVERGSVDDIFYRTGHPYTQGLLRCIPSLDGARKTRLKPIEGSVANPKHLPEGCYFAGRCEHCMKICQKTPPPEFVISPGHTSACWLRALEGSEVAVHE